METEDKKKSYTPAVKKAIDKYRSKNVEKYNELQRNYYNEAKEDEEWKKRFNERCRENNKKYRERKRLANPPKPKGRPRNAIPNINTYTIPV
jgi:hypothetical protein